MELQRVLERPGSPEQQHAIAIGTFDGVHIGHCQLLSSLVSQAKSNGLRSVVLTFERSPAEFFAPEVKRKYLCDLETRKSLIEEQGVDAVTTLRFDRSIQRLSAKQFLQVLRESANGRILVVGAGATIGHDQLRNAELQAAGDSCGIKVVVIEQLMSLDGMQVRASRIRAALADGDLNSVNTMLARHYTVRGTVVHGDRLGTEMGMPTANLDCPDYILLPKDGVYATQVELQQGEVYPAATSIGVRPTISDTGRRTVEAHIIGFSGRIYGSALRLRFIQRIRNEEKFDSMEKLKEVMRNDIHKTAQLVR